MKIPGWITDVWSPRAVAVELTPRQRLFRDAAWWSVGMFFMLLSMLLPFNGNTSVWPPIAAGLGFAVALRVRRTVPIVALLTVVVLGVWCFSESFRPTTEAWPPLMMCCLFVLSYLVGRLDDGRQPMLLQVAASIAMVVILSPLFGVGLQETFQMAILLVFDVIFPWLIGRYRFQNAELMTTGWLRAEQLEREHRAVADQARLRERTRIAEDMHDSLGHELSLIALRAAALEVDRQLPERHQDAAGQLRRSAATATERLREIIGLLRDETETASVAPVDETIGDLVERARESGMDVVFMRDEAPPLPHMADRAAHRVVQEALTNAAKHAPGAAVSILIESSEEYRTITVANDLPGADQSSVVSGGRGLVGLAERVRLAGGTFHSGPSVGRYEIVAKLPYHELEAVAETAEPDTESVRQHVHARTQARRRLLAAFVLPCVMVGVLGITTAGVLYMVDTNSHMSSERFGRLEEGMSREAAEELLPPFQMMDPPEDLGATELPDSAECEYYAGSDERPGRDDAYEVCFVDDTLVSKHTITSEMRENQFENRTGG